MKPETRESFARTFAAIMEARHPEFTWSVDFDAPDDSPDATGGEIGKVNRLEEAQSVGGGLANESSAA